MATRERPGYVSDGRRPRPPERRRQKTYLRRRIAAVSALVLAVVLVWFLYSLFQPFHGAGSGRVVVTIPRGASTDEIASTLSKDDVISSGFFFKLRVKISGDASKFHAGKFIMQHGMSYGSALGVLTSPPAQPAGTDVTLTPGLSRVQAQQKLHDSGISGDYVKLTRSSPLLNPSSYGAPKNTPSLEGFMWPDSYFMRDPVDIKLLIDKQLTRFKQEFDTVNFSWARSHGLTRYDVLIVASLISEEAYKPADYPRVAAVIYNRLRLGMDLGLDSTVSYATGNYGTLTEKDLHSSSRWNTTNHRGLPPTPINSPGMTDIRAAAHPAQTDALYFINRVCGNGALNFTNTYSVFLNWSAQWTAAVDKAAKNHGNAEFCGKSGKP